MIHYLKHNEIDKRLWDQCVLDSVNSRIYALSWYLGLVCPGWDALVEDEYASVFPLTWNRKAGIHYLFQPFFAQQLGLFSREYPTVHKLAEFIDALPSKFRFVEIHLNSLNRTDGLPYPQKFRVNHELEMGLPYDKLLANYAQNTRRNLKKAVDGGITLQTEVGAGELVDMFRDNFGKKEGKLKPRHYDIMQEIILYGQQTGRGYTLGAGPKEGALSAAAFFVQEPSRAYFLFAASAPAARENGAMFVLVDAFIRDHAGQSVTLDFEGGNVPGPGRFYKSFGALETNYPLLEINRLPRIIDRALHVKRKFRK